MEPYNCWLSHVALRSLDVFKQGLNLLSFLVVILLLALEEYILDGFNLKQPFVFKVLVSDLLTALCETFLGKALVSLVDQIAGVDR